MKPLCCLCRPGCAGVDADTEGGVACTLECSPCLHGCPNPDDCCMDVEIPVLSLWEPWATAIGRCKFAETRSWRPPLDNGSDLILAATAGKRPFREAVAAEPNLVNDLFHRGLFSSDLRFGQLVARVVFVTAVRTHEIVVDDTLELGWDMDDTGQVRVSTLEHRWGDYSPGRWAWLFAKRQIRHLPAVPFSGGQKLTKSITLRHVDTLAHDQELTGGR